MSLEAHLRSLSLTAPGLRAPTTSQWSTTAFLGWPSPAGSGSTYLLGLGRSWKRLPQSKSHTHDRVARKGGRSAGSGQRKQPSGKYLPLGDLSASATSAFRQSALPGYHSPNLVLGGAPLRSHNPSGQMMITANDLLRRPEPFLKTLGHIHTQRMLGIPGLPEGADWAINPVTLHWCRDQDSVSTEVCMVTYTSRNTCLPVYLLTSNNG